MARLPDIIAFARRCQSAVLSIEDIIDYRRSPAEITAHSGGLNAVRLTCVIDRLW